MRTLSVVGLAVVLTGVFSATTLHAAEKIGKIFIKAASSEVNGKQFSDQALEESATEMRKKKLGNFELATEESAADFLLVVVERKMVGAAVIEATLSFRDGGEWKPGTKLSGDSRRSWGKAAESVMKRAEEWVKANRRK